MQVFAGGVYGSGVYEEAAAAIAVHAAGIYALGVYEDAGTAPPAGGIYAVGVYDPAVHGDSNGAPAPDPWRDVAYEVGVYKYGVYDTKVYQGPVHAPGIYVTIASLS